MPSRPKAVPVLATSSLGSWSLSLLAAYEAATGVSRAPGHREAKEDASASEMHPLLQLLNDCDSHLHSHNHCMPKPTP